MYSPPMPKGMEQFARPVPLEPFETFQQRMNEATMEAAARAWEAAGRPEPVMSPEAKRLLEILAGGK
jgi:hypothetical protein